MRKIIGPPLGKLEKKYSHRWRKGKTNMGQEINRRRIIMDALERYERDDGEDELPWQAMQEDLYSFFSATTEDEKVGLHQKKFIKNYVDKKLRKERTGFAARSVLKSAARRKEKEPTADL